MLVSIKLFSIAIDNHALISVLDSLHQQYEAKLITIKIIHMCKEPGDEATNYC